MTRELYTLPNQTQEEVGKSAAKKKISHSSPQFEEIMKDLEAMLSEKEGRGTER